MCDKNDEAYTEEAPLKEDQKMCWFIMVGLPASVSVSLDRSRPSELCEFILLPSILSAQDRHGRLCKLIAMVRTLCTPIKGDCPINITHLILVSDLRIVCLIQFRKSHLNKL